ncbi:hypothetical protein [Streptomyces nojiriensis]|nr:hypothetical protein [Streptomyces nojiriensis]QTI50299.1 hypothetical protein JYK04_08176 [Streptomyces nojiriensis]
MTAGVHQAVTAIPARTKAEGTDQWADLLKAKMPAGQVRDAILASPAWPDIAAAMGRLDVQGIDVARNLTDAHRTGAGVDQSVAAVTAAAKIPTPAPAPAATVTPAPAPAAGAAVLARDGLAARMGAAGDTWAAPAPTPAPCSGGPAGPGRGCDPHSPAAAAPARGAGRAPVGSCHERRRRRVPVAGDEDLAPRITQFLR